MGDTKKKYTWEEVRKHQALESLWIVVNGGVYDVTKFVQHHPGGRHTLEMSGGQDVTYLMQTSHPFTEKPWKILKQYQIGVVEKFVTYAEEQPLYDEIKAKAKEYFETSGLNPKDPTFTIYVASVLLVLWVGGLYGFYHGSFLGAALLGAARSLFGIHTMHACSHYSVTYSPFVWKWGNWFCFDILMGSSHWAWDYQHIVGHHQHTNVFMADPDLPIDRDGDMRRLVPQQKWAWVYKYQHIYLPVLYLLLAFKVHVQDIMWLVGYDMNGKIPMNRSSTTVNMLIATKLFFFYYNVYVPLVDYQMDVSTFLQLFTLMECVSGGWLAYFFQVNHISSNVKYTDKDDLASTQQKEWAVMQIEGSVDYGHGSLAHVLFSGTLNYQTVHHLFPSVAPQHYPALAPLIQDSCEKFGVTYQCHSNYFVAAYHHVAELYRMGQRGEAAPMPNMD